MCIRDSPNTLLGSDEKEYFYDEPSGEYVFARDPQLFRLIVVYYQTGRLHYPPHQCVDAFDAELEFFGIESDVVADCCYELYRDRRHELTERLVDHRTLDGQRQTPVDTTLRARMWRGFECPRTSTVATVLYYVTGFFIAVSVIANVAETIPCGDVDRTCGEHFSTELFCVDTACVLLFTVEYTLRLYAAPARCRYALSVMSAVDLAAILPYYVALCPPACKSHCVWGSTARTSAVRW